MRRVTFCTITLIAFLGASACNKKTDQPTRTATSEGQTSSGAAGTTAAKQDRALVRFVNADPSHATTDLWFGDMKAFSDVAYKAVTPYTELPADRSTFKLRAVGQNVDLSTNNEGLNKGGHYTMVAIRSKDGATILRAITDEGGRFTIANVAPGTYDVRAQRIGQQAQTVSGVVVRSGEDARVDVALSALLVLAGAQLGPVEVYVRVGGGDDATVEQCNRFFAVMDLYLQIGGLDIGDCAGRARRQHRLDLRDGLSVLALLRENLHAQNVGVRARIIAHAQRLVDVGKRFLGFVCVLIGLRPAREREGVIGFKRQRFGEGGDGFVISAVP